MQQGDFRVPKPRIESGRVLRTRVPAPAPFDPSPPSPPPGEPVDLSPVADPLTYVRWALLLQEQLGVSHAERERLLQEVARMQHEVASLRQAIAAREQEIAATLREAKGEEAAATFEAKAAAAAASAAGTGGEVGIGGPVQRDASFKLNDENIQVLAEFLTKEEAAAKAAEAKRPADAEPLADAPAQKSARVDTP